MRSLPKLNRLTGYDYSQTGVYFITICVHNRECVFGKIIHGNMALSTAGQIAHDCWSEIPRHFAGVSLDEFVVMPNHVHGIIIINDETGNVIIGNGFTDAIHCRERIYAFPTMAFPTTTTIITVAATITAQ